jgi:chromosome segregation ATPase
VRNKSSESILSHNSVDLKLTAAVLDLFLEASPDLEIKDLNGFEAVHYLYENVKISDEFKAEVVRKLVSKGNHVSEEMPWLGIDLPFLEKKLELLPGPPIPTAVKAVFEAENERFDRIKIASCVAENEKQAAKINELTVNNTKLEKQAEEHFQSVNQAAENTAKLDLELDRAQKRVSQINAELDKKVKYRTRVS